jgi:hypothetical protein
MTVVMAVADKHVLASARPQTPFVVGVAFEDPIMIGLDMAHVSDWPREDTEPLLWRLTDRLRDLVRADLACADCERSTTLLLSVLSLRRVGVPAREREREGLSSSAAASTSARSPVLPSASAAASSRRMPIASNAVSSRLLKSDFPPSGAALA